MQHYNMNLTLKVWRQKSSKFKGHFETFKVKNISSEMSFLEMFDVLNEQLVAEGKEPIAFDHDCREGICGACSMYINGRAHGPWHETTTCQLHMREYKDGDTIVVEPWRANAFPVIKDLVVDRQSAFDRIIASGGYVSVNTGNAVDANALPIEKPKLMNHLQLLAALVAELVLRLVLTLRLCCSFLQRYLTLHCCHRVSQSAKHVR
jgi:succinate dehydrogenase / fumarate reductase iron-sulfur subunit